MNTKTAKKILPAIFLILILIPLKVGALEYGGLGGKPAHPDPSNDRTKSIFLFTLEPKQSKQDGILVVNNTSETKDILVYATDSQKSSDGSFACEQYSDTKDLVGSWIKLDKEELTLNPSTNEVIPFTITAPESASVGEENGCIMIQERKTNSTESGVSLSFRTGLRVVVTIPGEQIRELQISNFTYSQKEDGIISTKFEIENKGNVSIDSNIVLNMNSVFGQNIYQANNQYPILRGDTSVYNFEIAKPFWGGIFNLNANVQYDKSLEAIVGKDTDNPKTILEAQNYTIFIIPEPLAIIIEAISILVLISLIYIGYKRFKRNKVQKKLWIKKYEVKENQDIESIAKEFGLNWKDIVKFNKLQPPYILKEGQKLVLPKTK